MLCPDLPYVRHCWHSIRPHYCSILTSNAKWRIFILGMGNDLVEILRNPLEKLCRTAYVIAPLQRTPKHAWAAVSEALSRSLIDSVLVCSTDVKQATEDIALRAISLAGSDGRHPVRTSLPMDGIELKPGGTCSDYECRPTKSCLDVLILRSEAHSSGLNHQPQATFYKTTSIHIALCIAQF